MPGWMCVLTHVRASHEQIRSSIGSASFPVHEYRIYVHINNVESILLLHVYARDAAINVRGVFPFEWIEIAYVTFRETSLIADSPGSPVSDNMNRFVFCLFLGTLGIASAYLDTTRDRGLDLLRLIEKYSRRNNQIRRDLDDDLVHWTGRWLPDQPGESTSPSKIVGHDEIIQNYPMYASHRVQMGHASPDCDDGQVNITIDWDHSPVNYTCYDKKIIPDYSIHPMIYCENIPVEYMAIHKCMNERIEYNEDIPLYGTHRPLWPVYGEYKFLPKQRWLHSLEHGAVVMLYHPCANPLERNRLKALVKSCLRRYVISPYNLLDEDKPLALLTWGCRLTMSYVNPARVKEYIREKALRGPEQISDEGDFKDGLLSPAQIVSDQEDSILCPNN